MAYRDIFLGSREETPFENVPVNGVCVSWIGSLLSGKGVSVLFALLLLDLR
jgi:hypothetical protein